MQISHLVSEMKEETASGDTMKQLQDKIASLSQLQFARSSDALVMIWSGVTGPLAPPAPGPTYTSSTPNPALPNWNRTELAPLKSIHTGVFIDIKINAYSAINGDLPLHPKPLFASSIVIGEWVSAVATRKS